MKISSDLEQLSGQIVLKDGAAMDHPVYLNQDEKAFL